MKAVGYWSTPEIPLQSSYGRGDDVSGYSKEIDATTPRSHTLHTRRTFSMGDPLEPSRKPLVDMVGAQPSDTRVLFQPNLGSRGDLWPTPCAL